MCHAMPTTMTLKLLKMACLRYLLLTTNAVVTNMFGEDNTTQLIFVIHINTCKVAKGSNQVYPQNTD